MWETVGLSRSWTPSVLCDAEWQDDPERTWALEQGRMASESQPHQTMLPQAAATWCVEDRAQCLNCRIMVLTVTENQLVPSA